MHALTTPERTLRRYAQRLHGMKAWLQRAELQKIPGYSTLSMADTIEALTRAELYLDYAFKASRSAD